MQKSKIEWCDYSINPVKGLCPMACDYCYARRMYKRFKWNPEIRVDGWVWQKIPSFTLNRARVFVGSTMELFGDWVDYNDLRLIFDCCRNRPSMDFIFLTKQPQNLQTWSPYPENCWVGVSATDYWMYVSASNYLSQIKAQVKFISLEPLLLWDKRPSYFFDSGGINWLVIGQQTPIKKTTAPKIEWIRGIVEAADNAGVPVFLKDNLQSLFTVAEEPFFKFARPSAGATEKGYLRQEFPK